MSLMTRALVFLLLVPGVCSQWRVSYSRSQICALQDSTVMMSCTYTHPTGHQINKAFWTKTQIKDEEEFPDLSDDPEYSRRLQYLRDTRQKISTFTLSHVTLKDEHKYYFRFITDQPDGKWLGVPGVTLNVTDLQVESPERVAEGDSVTLACKSRCALTDRSTFIWYRNSLKILTESNFSNKLLLDPVRREDSGTYSCGVDGHTHISPDVQLNVMWGRSHGWLVWLGITVACLGFFIVIIIILFIMRKRRVAKAEDLTEEQDNPYSTVSGRDVHVSESVDRDDVQYDSVTSSNPRGDAPERRDTEEIQYASVQHHRITQMKRAEEDGSHYDNIRIRQPDAAARRLNVQTVEEASVIYSRVK